MLLSNVRKHAYSRWMKVIYLLIALSFFGGFGIAGYLRGCGKSMDDATIAVVRGQAISVAEYTRAYSNYLQYLKERLGDNFNEDLVAGMDLRNKILRDKVQSHLILQRAGEMGLTVSDDEVRAHIARTFADEQGRFDLTRYQSALRGARVRVTEYEESQRQAILMSKVEDLIGGSVVMTDADVAAAYRMKNEKVNLSFAAFRPAATPGAPPAGSPSLEDARARAQAFLASLKPGMAPPAGADIEETGFFSRDDAYIPKIGASADGIIAAFSLTKTRPVAPEPLLIDGRYYVLWLKGTQEMSPARFAKEKEEFSRTLLRERRQMVYQRWVQSLLDSAEITVNNPVLDAMGARGKETQP